MQRATSFLIAAVCLALGSSALAAEHQGSGVGDVRAQQFFLPGTNTLGSTIHGSRTVMGLRLPQGFVVATGGYKIALTYSHSSQLAYGSTNVEIPVAGSVIQAQAALGSGVLYQRMPSEGTILAVSISARAAVTTAAAHAQATLNGVGIPLRAVIGAGLAQTRFNSATASTINQEQRFVAGDRVGCQLTTDATIAPVGINNDIICTVTVRY